ncbi:MAG: 2-C-methyl-D-erythritol 4-phosphate cytidylyltransferase [Verrucomicrobiales bacterium]|jgi:2-C-methyl-D-erythritol 4-phosphate cytidylyltransferase|nr:2-C-methyl-D-erythritol 4-phosphate cytidylyltransferase [Verrucomicrobiales bacterium]
MKSCSAILLAAGRSRRLGFDKILTPLAGRPVLHYALEALKSSPQIVEVILVTREDILSQVKEIAEAANGENPVKYVIGGAERQDSVFNGLQEVSPLATEVLIHDAARPLLDEVVISDTLKVAREKGAAVTAHRANDTLKEADEQQQVTVTLDRSKIWAMGTPQIFRRELVVSAYEKVQREKLAITDDASAVELLGHPVYLVDNPRLNLKITRQADWELLELWLQRGSGEELRKKLHDLSNQLMPLIGYLPLLEHHANDGKYVIDCLQKMKIPAQLAPQSVREIQELARQLFPDPK